MQVFEGVVVSNKMLKTVVVEVVRKITHPLYKKLLKRSKRHKAETRDFSVSIGDRVKIIQTRPLSKDKHFKILEVLKK